MNKSPGSLLEEGGSKSRIKAHSKVLLKYCRTHKVVSEAQRVCFKTHKEELRAKFRMHPGHLLERAELLGAVWKSTSELGYPESWRQRRVDGVEPPRHRADAVTETTLRRRCGAPEI